MENVKQRGILRWLALILVTLFLDFWELHGPLSLPINWVAVGYPIAQTLGVALAVLLAWKNGVFKDSLTFFYWKNLLILGISVILGLVFIQWGAQLYFEKVPALAGGVNPNSDISVAVAQIPFWFMRLGDFVIGPIFEELIFREYLYRLIPQKDLAFVLSVISFAWLHTGFTWAFFYYLPGALVITLIYFRRKSVCDSIVAHGLINVAVDFGLIL